MDNNTIPVTLEACVAVFTKANFSPDDVHKFTLCTFPNANPQVVKDLFEKISYEEIKVVPSQAVPNAPPQ